LNQPDLRHRRVQLFQTHSRPVHFASGVRPAGRVSIRRLRTCCGWYATCCGTPMFNNAAQAPSLPCQHHAALCPTLRALWAIVDTGYIPTSSGKPGQRGLAAVDSGAASRAAAAKITGRFGKPTPLSIRYRDAQPPVKIVRTTSAKPSSTPCVNSVLRR